MNIEKFFNVPLKADLNIPKGSNPLWYQARERIFTMIARVSAFLGTASLLLTAPTMTSLLETFLPYALILILVWVLGLARNIRYRWRAVSFLAMAYGMGVVEALNYGFSVECFVFFMGFVSLSALLSPRRGSLATLLLALVTLGVFAVAIGAKMFTPFVVLARGGTLSPASVQAGINNLLVFSGGALAVTISIIALLENLQSAWQKESASLDLLQQERDLLEQRITARTLELQDAEVKYRTLVEQLPLVAYRDSADSAALTHYISPQIEAMLGYSQSAWGEDSELWHKSVHPDDREHARQTIEETLRNGSAVMEYRLFSIDGREIWVRDNSALVRDENGQPLFVQGTLEDITAQKQADEQIRKLSQAVEQSGSSVVITDLDGNIEYVNPQFTKTTGYSFEEALGQNPRILKSGRQGIEFYQKMWAIISSGKTWRGVFHNKRKDGSLYWESATITPVINPGGGVTHYIAIKEDITRQKEVEDALHQSYQAQSVLNSLLSLALEDQTLEEMLDRALNVILTIPWLPTLPKGGIFLVDESLNTLALKSHKNLDASLLTMCGRVPFGHCLCGRAAAEAKTQFANCVDTRHDNTYAGMQPHGHYNIPILLRDEALGVLVLYLDAGRARDPREEAFLEAVTSVLASMIRDKQAERELSQARDQALDASAFKSQILSRVSHELRTPLSGVLGYAELLQFEAFGALNDEQRNAASQIANSARYLEYMIQDLLDQSQIDAKSIALYVEPFSPAELLARVEASLSTLARNKGLYIQSDIAPDLPASIVGDENRIQQVVVNLVGNAVKYTRQGGVTIRLYRPSSERWAIEVRDTGAGIPEATRAYIFEPFRRLDNSITRENRGAGLGLSIARQLVDLMGGEILLESEVDKGSAFTVLLPLIPATGEFT